MTDVMFVKYRSDGRTPTRTSTRTRATVKYLHISKVARKVLAAPASSTRPAEGVFSTAGNLVTKNRAALSREHKAALVCPAMNTF